MFDKISENFGAILVIALGVIILSFSMISFCSSGNITSYYFQTVSGQREVQIYCVYGNINWRLDPVISCSTNISDSLMLVTALNSRDLKVKIVDSGDLGEQPQPKLLKVKEEKF